MRFLLTALAFATLAIHALPTPPNLVDVSGRIDAIRRAATGEDTLKLQDRREALAPAHPPNVSYGANEDDYEKRDPVAPAHPPNVSYAANEDDNDELIPPIRLPWKIKRNAEAQRHPPGVSYAADEDDYEKRSAHPPNVSYAADEDD